MAEATTEICERQVPTNARTSSAQARVWQHRAKRPLARLALRVWGWHRAFALTFNGLPLRHTVHTAYCADSTSALSASDGSVGVSSTALSWRLRGKWSSWNSSRRNRATLVASKSPVMSTCALLCVLAGTNDRLYGVLCNNTARNDWCQ
jgi:hypothetical protein